MLTFEQKLAVIESFSELQRKDVSLGRVNFHYAESVLDKKTVVYHLHPNGNGYVYAGNLAGYAADPKGMVNIRDYTEEELRAIIRASIDSLAPGTHAGGAASKGTGAEIWSNRDKEKLVLVHEHELWNVYAGSNLEMAFETREEAVEYLHEEGFIPSK
ncbi:hypothetical protein [Paenibacillus apiarius]|uniref:Uncharacterized protein n=1 Tax=Paenibacillus apiarius TaxID=46240 RepID=A0ABT4DQ88_9BACL|nr:hypothetical protein [Paenibacillus apiarius]MCY9513899.1 hypothetical protein [Paenibacillus apiarius]MCY9519416.1 hypothetical protein [Paenibacillus apiarius]MCY9552357.1 hypothetical protein [Paenibacillus apiarius]MCY9556171.1 hypothetical protein [Paenibacillus apiarius]MCY9681706.1 hypothetical protein [Paenibacillus apiarius]